MNLSMSWWLVQELRFSVALSWVAAISQLTTTLVITYARFSGARFHFVGPQAVTVKERKVKDK